MTCDPLLNRDGRRVGFLCDGPPVQTYHDGRRTWRWQEGPSVGLVVLDRHGEPLTRQPGPRSTFWSAYEAHAKENPR